MIRYYRCKLWELVSQKNAESTKSRTQVQEPGLANVSELSSGVTVDMTHTSLKANLPPALKKRSYLSPSVKLTSSEFVAPSCATTVLSCGWLVATNRLTLAYVS